jgi:hypothetical protein
LYKIAELNSVAINNLISVNYILFQIAINYTLEIFIYKGKEKEWSNEFDWDVKFKKMLSSFRQCTIYSIELLWLWLWSHTWELSEETKRRVVINNEWWQAFLKYYSGEGDIIIIILLDSLLISMISLHTTSLLIPFLIVEDTWADISLHL